jgi:methyl-accepting chemotaxis protein
MLQLFARLLSEYDLLLIIFSIFTILIAATLYIRRSTRANQISQLHTIALENMSQGICVFDSGQRLILCNKRYLEMYDLQHERVSLGATLREIVDLRYKAGSSPKMSKEEYVHWRESIKVSDKPSETMVELMNGQIFEIRHRPMPNGGWVATHEDITERQHAERQRTSMVEQEKRRLVVDDAIMSFRESVETVLRTVGESSATMKSMATSLSTSSHLTSQRTSDAVQTSNGASISVEAATAAAVELSASISSISQQLHATTVLVETAVTEASTANAEISGLARSAGEIGDIVKVIQMIAGQTNLLALNATIEAARAGEAGRGFAVVASEVKSLAVQTAKATEQIAAQISAVQTSATAAVEAIHRNADRMQEINQHTSAVAACVEEQNSATDAISYNVANATTGTQDIRATLNEVDRAVTETLGSAQTVLAASESVETAANQLREKVTGFLDKVAV